MEGRVKERYILSEGDRKTKKEEGGSDGGIRRYREGEREKSGVIKRDEEIERDGWIGKEREREREREET